MSAVRLFFLEGNINRVYSLEISHQVFGPMLKGGGVMRNRIFESQITVKRWSLLRSTMYHEKTNSNRHTTSKGGRPKAPHGQHLCLLVPLVRLPPAVGEEELAPVWWEKWYGVKVHGMYNWEITVRAPTKTIHLRAFCKSSDTSRPPASTTTKRAPTLDDFLHMSRVK